MDIIRQLQAILSQTEKDLRGKAHKLEEVKKRYLQYQ